MRIKIASRKSDLARVQAYQVGDALKKAWPDLEVEFIFRESLGDKNLTDPLWKMPEKGVFTQDFYDDLVGGRTDMVVHSWKDLPVENREGTEIFATMPRADMRDLLLVKKTALNAAHERQSIRIFSSSPRREYNLTPFLKTALPGGTWKSIDFSSVRGNVPTRMQKMMEALEIDGLVVAKAAIDRLLNATREEFSSSKTLIRQILNECYWMVLPLEANPTAAAQGALAIEVASNRDDIKKLIMPIHCAQSFEAVKIEREILTGFGGGCHQKVGASVLNKHFGQVTYMRAFTDKTGAVEDVKLKVEFNNKQAHSDFISNASQVSRNQIFPLLPNEAKWFERKMIPTTLPDGALFVARANAWPEGAKVKPGQLIWASGLETWKKLAKKGIWVNGSSESLGEEEDPQINSLLDVNLDEIKWTKLTHTKGSKSSKMKLLATYELIPSKEVPNIKGKTHFFWMSGTSFDRALELNPWLAQCEHSCGPGNTFHHIKAKLGRNAKLTLFLSHKQWLESVTR